MLTSSFIRAGALALTTTLFVGADAQDICVNQDSPNPIARQWPSEISGNLNGTTMIVPLDLGLARSIIPAQYGILERAYRAVLPEFPKGMYPMMAVAVHDHDIQLPAFNLSLPDFSRTALEFPFLDVLGDGYSSFRWAATMMITEGSPAIEGSEGFGIKVYPSIFNPSCNAYSSKLNQSCGTAVLHAESSSDESRQGKRFLAMETRLDEDAALLYPIAFLRNITNQPVFANPTICDNYKRLFNTSLTAPPNEPVPVRGSVKAKLEPFDDQQHVWRDVYGWRLSTAFLEPPVPSTCESLQGYQGTGPGDST